jgi:hypothetical protein
MLRQLSAAAFSHIGGFSCAKVFACNGVEAHLSETRCSRSSSRKRPRKPLAPVSSTCVGCVGSSEAGAAAAAAALSASDKKRSSFRSDALIFTRSLPWIDSKVIPALASPLQVQTHTVCQSAFFLKMAAFPCPRRP